MIIKKYRIVRKKDWQRIKKEGKSLNCRWWKAVFLPEESNKFACLVTKKNWIKAVIRNRVRRRIQEVVYKSFMRPEQKLKTGWWLLIPRPGIEKLNQEILIKEWGDTLLKFYV